MKFFNISYSLFYIIISLLLGLSWALPCFAISDADVTNAFNNVELAFEEIEQEVNRINEQATTQAKFNIYIINNILIIALSLLCFFFTFGSFFIEKNFTNLSSAKLGANLKKSVNLSIMMFMAVFLCLYAFGYNLIFNSFHSSSLNFPVRLSLIDEFIISFFDAFSFKGASNKEIASQAFDVNSLSKHSELILNIAYPFIALMVITIFLKHEFHIIALFIFAIFFSIFIYPIVTAWVWGGGFLLNGTTDASDGGTIASLFKIQVPFADFGGASLVHVVAGICFITAKISAVNFPQYFHLKARQKQDEVSSINMNNNGWAVILHQLSILNIFFAMLILMILSHPYIADETGISVTSINKIIFNSILAAASSFMVALFYNFFLLKKELYTISLPAIIAGLVAISAEPLHPNPNQAIFVGAIAGLIVAFAPLTFSFFKERLYNPFAVHFLCGIWGVLSVPISFIGASFKTQILGLFFISIYVFISSLLLWFFIKIIKQIIYGDEYLESENRNLIVR